jgi:hypothetical protein
MEDQFEFEATLTAFHDMISEDESGFDDLGLWDDPPIDNEPLTLFINVQPKNRN